MQINTMIVGLTEASHRNLLVGTLLSLWVVPERIGKIVVESPMPEVFTAGSAMTVKYLAGRKGVVAMAAEVLRQSFSHETFNMLRKASVPSSSRKHSNKVFVVSDLQSLSSNVSQHSSEVLLWV